MMTIAALLSGITVLLCAAHYAAVAWPALAYQEKVARPLRLDLPESFGRWLTGTLLALSAATSLMIYQLRRYRIDDFQGRYRLWRLVLVVLLAASVNSLVSIIDWSGALIDAAFGRRVALTGDDWIRLFVSFGGAVLALRLIAEVRRSRFSLSMMILAIATFALPEAANWNILQVDTLFRWVAVTSAPLIGCTALSISLVAYLRMLYREVQQIEEHDSLTERFQQMRLRVFQRSEASDSEANEPQTEERSKQRPGRHKASAAKKEVSENSEEGGEPIADQDDKTRSTGRRWFGLRRAKADTVDSTKPAEEESESKPTPKKQGRFSMRRKRGSSESTDDQDPRTDDESAQQPEEKNARVGRNWLGRRKKAEPEPTDEETLNSAESTPPANSAASESQPVDPEEIDWDSMSKAERRRLRKQLKRQNRAA